MARPFTINRTSGVPSLFAPSSNGTPALEDDRFADADDVFEETEIAFPAAGPHVAEFTHALDKFTSVQGSPEEKRSQIFKLVDHFYEYSRSQAEARKDGRSRSRSRSGNVLPSVEGRDRGEESNEMDVDEGDEGDDIKSVVSRPAERDDLQRWEDEAKTWDLLRRVLPLRYHDKAAASSHNAMTTDSPLRTRKQYWEEFILSDSQARERKVVLEWLQASSEVGPSIDEIVSDFQREADRGDILAHGWLHTRHKIKLQKSVNAYQGVLDPKDRSLEGSLLSSNTLVTQLDPDAMTRQGRHLEPQDTAFEQAIWLGCFEMLKRGYTMAEVRDWCAERTESWRAASMSPLALSNPDDEDVKDFNPVFAVLWRRMCYATARDGGSNDYERAVYGVLAGDVPSVEKIIHTWDEHLFAHYNALLRTQFDAFLVKQGGGDVSTVAAQFPSFNAVQAHGDPVAIGRRIISALEANYNTKSQALSPAKGLQGAIVANDLDRFLSNQGALLAKEANSRRPSKLIPDLGGPLPDSASAHPDKFVRIRDREGVRIAAHVAIIISSLDRLLGADDDSYSGPLGTARYRHQESIISAYIIMLRLYRMIDSVPLYCSKLHGDRVYTNLARNLVDVTGDDGRKSQLVLISKLGLDVRRFVVTGVREYLEEAMEGLDGCEAKQKFKIMQPGPAALKYGRPVQPDFFGEDAEFVDEEDENIIRYLEWIMLVPGLFAEAIDYATRTYVYFLNGMRLRAARSLARRVPLQRIVQEKTDIALASFDEDDDLLDPSEWFTELVSSPAMDDVVQETGLHKEHLLYAIKNMWDLECMVRALDQIETLASLAHLMRAENTGGKDFIMGVSKETRLLRGFMKPVMKDWLTTGRVTGEFKELREAYIPEVVLAYISSLQFAGTTATREYLMECMELAAQIADKDGHVAKLFITAGRMKELVEAFASASKALAIWSGEKKSSALANTKKNRELGWSRELWSVRP